MKIVVGLSATGKQGPNFGKGVSEIADEITAVKAELDALRPEWRHALAFGLRASTAKRMGVSLL